MALGYEIHVFVCENERPADHPRGCCAAKDGGKIRLWFKESMARHGVTRSFRVNRAGCLDYCELGPVVVVYPDAIWYSPKNREDVEEIVTQHFAKGEVVERLRIVESV